MFFNITIALFVLGLEASNAGSLAAILVLMGGHSAILTAIVLLCFPLRVVSGTIMFTTLYDFQACAIYFGTLWAVSGRIRNRLAHALNGNIAPIRRVALMLLPFVIFMIIAFALDICTGFKYGALGYADIVVSMSVNRLGRFGTIVFGILGRLHLAILAWFVLIVLSPPLLGLFVVYDALVVLFFMCLPADAEPGRVRLFFFGGLKINKSPKKQRPSGPGPDAVESKGPAPPPGSEEMASMPAGHTHSDSEEEEGSGTEVGATPKPSQ